MSLQSEVCLWTLLGLIRTIFDATLFKVNANLKQVSNQIQYPLSCVFCKSNINLTPTLLKPPTVCSTHTFRQKKWSANIECGHHFVPEVFF